MGDSAEQETKESGEREKSTTPQRSMSSVTAKKKERNKADTQTTSPLSSHHGDIAPHPQREQPLGSEHTHPAVWVGGEHYSELVEVARRGEAIPMQETVVNHSTATQQLVTGRRGNGCASLGVMRPCHFSTLT